MLFNSTLTNIHSISHDFNNIHPNLDFTSESESNSCLNYLDITIHRTKSNMNFHIFRKPTFTDTIIPRDSCHPSEHKYAAIRYLYNRLHTYNLNEAKTKEYNTISNILYNNKYHVQTTKLTQNETGKKWRELKNICLFTKR
jgi:hypothetical protein